MNDLSITALNLPQGDAEGFVPSISKGMLGMISLISAESAIFTIFVVAYIYYLGRNVSGPTPRQVLELPIFNTVCLLSSSFTIWRSEHSIARGDVRRYIAWWTLTLLLGAIFLAGTAQEWHKLITVDHLTIGTNLFGTTFYSLVGLHATHVVIGLGAMLVVLALALRGAVGPQHSERIKILALYWHFVDAVWVVVFTVVYLVGR